MACSMPGRKICGLTLARRPPYRRGHYYLESVSRLDAGFRSALGSLLSKFKSHNSNLFSLVKSASIAPARVPVTMEGLALPADQAKAAVRGISRSRPIIVSELFRYDQGASMMGNALRNFWNLTNLFFEVRVVLCRQVLEQYQLRRSAM